MLFHIPGEHQRQRAVSGDVASGAEAVLQGENGQHQGGAGVVKEQDAGDEAQGGHDRSAGDAGSADGEDTQQQAEQDHGADAGQRAIEQQGDGHDEEHLRQHGAAQVDVGEQGNAEADHVLPQHLALAGAAQGHCQRRRAGHGTYGGQVGRAVVAEDLPGIFAGIGAGQQIQHRQPDVVAGHDDEDDLQKGGQLAGDHALIAEVAESGGDIEREHGDDDLADDVQHDGLELTQKVDGALGFGPGSGQAQQHGEHQGAHDAHDLGNIQLEHHLRQLLQACHAGVNGQVGDQGIAGTHAHEGRTDGGDVGDDHGHAQKTGGIGAQLGDGGRDKADDDQRHAEVDELAHDVLQRDDHFHDALRKHGTARHTHENSQDQSKR